MTINPSLYSTKKHDWQTPPEVFAPLHEEFGFTVDAAASADNAMLPRFWTVESDGLAQPWAGERVWCNPPYGRMQRQWIEKAYKREAEVAVLLLPSRTDTVAWHNWVLPAAEVRFLRGRIRFVGAEHGAPFPSAVVIWRRQQ